MYVYIFAFDRIVSHQQCTYVLPKVTSCHCTLHIHKYFLLVQAGRVSKNNKSITIKIVADAQKSTRIRN